jgi:glycine dehydrogenase subunit 1
MLEAIGAEGIEDLYISIPASLRLDRPLALPEALDSEQRLKRHMMSLLERNRPTSRALSFLGAGCYPHYVPAVCSEVNGRAEFLTAYAGEPYEDHGKWQAIFEYTSLMAELLEMDVVSVPTYDGYQAAATALRMAIRITERPKVLVSEAVLPAKRAKIAAYLEGAGELVTIPVDRSTGSLGLATVAGLLASDVAAVFVETPNALGVVEVGGPELAEAAHANGSLLVYSVDPIALGYLESPASWGADILCGDIQSLGLGMHFGGAHGGFIAAHDEERFVFEFPSRLFGLAPTVRDGELGFTDIAYERTSLARREEGVEWVGTAAALWGITAGVYLALMGPKGMMELGSTVAALTRYAIQALEVIPGVEVPFSSSAHWRECAVRYEGRSAEDVNARLLELGIYGGADISGQYEGEENLSLYCFTELHTRSDIDRLVDGLTKVLR